jgi:hypothetical protein
MLGFVHAHERFNARRITPTVNQALKNIVDP